MKKLAVVLLMALASIFAVSKIQAQDSREPISIHIGLFKSAMPEGNTLKEAIILLSSTHPQLSQVDAKLDGPESEVKSAITEALLDILNLETLDSLGFFEKPWQGKESAIEWRIVDKPIGLLYRCTPHWDSSGSITLTMTLLASKEVSISEGLSADDELRRFLEATSNEAKMQKVAENKILLERNQTCVMAIPYRNQIYMVMTSWTTLSAVKTSLARTNGHTTPEAPVLGVPKPTYQVMPAYPNDLRLKGVKGVVKLQLTIDRVGEVVGAKVVQSAHPYLDYAVTQALLQWKFAPFLKDGKSVSVTTMFTFEFDPEKYASFERAAKGSDVEQVTDESLSQGSLQEILNDCAVYCRKLESAALFFVCEEKLMEIHNYFSAGKSRIITMEEEGRGRDQYGTPIYQGVFRKVRVIEPDRTEKNQYVSDYQLIRKDGQVQERRIVLKKNGRDTSGQKEYLENSHYSVLMPIFAVMQLLSGERQTQFNYRLLPEDTTAGIEAYIIEAMPKLGTAGNVERARIWVAKRGYQILMVEIEGVPLAGYDDVFQDAAALLIKPSATITNFFQAGKNGIMFPSRVMVDVRYPANLQDAFVTKLKIDMNYDKYKFFAVETEHQIIK